MKTLIRQKRLTLTEKAEMALREAVQEVIEENIRLGLPLVVWKGGKVVKIPPKKLRKK